MVLKVLNVTEDVVADVGVLVFVSWKLNELNDNIDRFLKVFFGTASQLWKDKLKQVRTVIYQVLKHDFWQSQFNPSPKSFK
jgi:hypothetical protein